MVSPIGLNMCPRALNKKARAPVNWAQDQKQSCLCSFVRSSSLPHPPVAVRGFGDGGVRAGGRDGVGDSLATCAWVLEASCCLSSFSNLDWQQVSKGAIVLGTNAF